MKYVTLLIKIVFIGCIAALFASRLSILTKSKFNIFHHIFKTSPFISTVV